MSRSHHTSSLFLRSRTFSTAGKASGIAPSRLIALQEDDKASSRDEKEGSGSEGSEEGCESLVDSRRSNLVNSRR